MPHAWVKENDTHTSVSGGVKKQLGRRPKAEKEDTELLIVAYESTLRGLTHDMHKAVDDLAQLGED